jgi:NOL1/NOP2/fmu family ribosome biogenesis protein
LAEKEDRAFLLSYMNDRFGIAPDLFDGYLLFKKKKAFWFMKSSGLLQNVSHLKIKRLGIRAFQEVGSFMKPATRIIQYFGHLATKAVIDLEDDQLKILIKGEYLPINLDLENGYVILSYKEQVLGLGLLIDGKVRSQLPVKDVKFLRFI